jgi:hypothetical protein
VAAERRHGVHDDQRAGLVRDGRDLPNRVADAGGRLGVDHADDVRLLARQRLADALRVARPAPLDVEPRHAPAVALADRRKPVTEVAGHDGEDASAVLHEIGDGRLEAGRAGAGHREGERSLRRPEQGAQLSARFVHHRHQVRVEVPEHGRRQRAHHARRDHARPGPEQQAFGCG